MQLRNLQLLGEGIFLEVEDLEIWARRLYHFRIVCEMLRLSSERHFFEATLGPPSGRETWHAPSPQVKLLDGSADCS